MIFVPISYFEKRWFMHSATVNDVIWKVPDMSLQLTIGSVDYGAARVFKLEGFLAQLEIYRFKRAVDQALIDGKRVIVADVEKVDFIDSSGIASLIHMRKEATQMRVDAVLIASPRSNVSRILESTNLGGFMRIFSTKEEAFEHCGITVVEPEKISDVITQIDIAK